MMRKTMLIGTAVALAWGCARAPAATPTPKVAQTVFSDSLKHVALCEAPKPGQSWRTACQPKDQSPTIFRAP